jgi:predicted N-formylglutamate amidohydrolase
MKGIGVLVTCEHGGHDVPSGYRSLFANRTWLLRSHRGWDPGALPLARYIAERQRAPLFFSVVTRLLVDLNRTAPRNRFSSISRRLDSVEQRRVLATFYQPYRAQVERAISEVIGGGRVALHLSIHTFTPLLHGRTRRFDAGLLYDPARPAESVFCRNWKKRMEDRLPRWVIRLNEPYRGRDDGFTRWLRTRFPGPDYLGVELEVNQRLACPTGEGTSPWFPGMAASLHDAVESSAVRF